MRSNQSHAAKLISLLDMAKLIIEIFQYFFHISFPHIPHYAESLPEYSAATGYSRSSSNDKFLIISQQ